MYEASFYLAVIFASSVQASSSLSHIPDLYFALDLKAPSSAKGRLDARPEALSLISLVFHLCEAFPSQSTFYRHLRVAERFLRPNSTAYKWVSSVRASLNCRNYSRFETLTRSSRIKFVLESLELYSTDEAVFEPHLAEMALHSLVNSLRRKFRSVAWDILRFAYRELNLDDQNGSASWLCRCLLLESVDKEERSIGAGDWMEQTSKTGLVARKEGSQDRWLLKR